MRNTPSLLVSRRAVVTDDGRQIRLTVYEGGDGHIVELTPLHALALADDLLGVALPRLADEAKRQGGAS